MVAPQVSVLIIAHNRAHTIGAAVRSVLAQTLTDFELVVVDDGSTDDTAEVLDGFRDPRLRLVRTSFNQGIPQARNRALAEARGEFIAWLDSDDICHPERLRLQLEHLSKHPELQLIGSAARRINGAGSLKVGGRVPVRSHEEIRALLLFRSAFQQSSLFGRAGALRKVPYDPAFPVCEDVDMFVRFTERYRAANLPDFLIARRLHDGQTIRNNVERILERQGAISARQLDQLGLSVEPGDLRRHVLLGKADSELQTDALLDWAEGWMGRVVEANRRKQLFGPDALRSCFERLLMKAALRRVAAEPSEFPAFLRRARRHRAGTARMVIEAAQGLLPFAGRAWPAGMRQVLEPSR
jgi:glycosyltransferase involved in cell wall biosynthesis